jgi:hypothetical protein
VIARLLELLRAAPATAARMGGYWGGVVMRGLDRATAFMRR